MVVSGILWKFEVASRYDFSDTCAFLFHCAPVHCTQYLTAILGQLDSLFPKKSRKKCLIMTFKAACQLCQPSGVSVRPTSKILQLLCVDDLASGKQWLSNILNWHMKRDQRWLQDFAFAHCHVTGFSLEQCCGKNDRKFLNCSGSVPIALASSSRVVAASSAVRLKPLTDTESHLSRTAIHHAAAAAVVRPSDSDSGRSSLASCDNHSIGSDTSPTLNSSLIHKNTNSIITCHHHSSPRPVAVQSKLSG